MRILLISQIYLPEIGALANRMYPIVRQLVAEGHEVFVATGMPNYPRGVVFPEYQGKRFVRESKDGSTILRTAYFTAPRNQSKATQLLSYLSFIPAVFHSGLRAGRVDVVFVTSPPLFPAIAAILLAKLWKAKLVADIRDLWPDEFVAYGGMSEQSIPVRLMRAIERWTYRSADCICATTRAILDTVVERGTPAEKMMLAPNGADLDLFRPLPRENPQTAPYPFGGKFVVMYSGLFGIKHGLEVLLEAAFLLRDEPTFLFFLVGGGARQDALIERAAELQLENVLFAGEQGVEEIPWLLAAADVCFAAVRPEAYAAKLISVKIFEYLACEKPVLGCLHGESARVLEESGAGVVVPPGDARALAAAILEMYHRPEERMEMARRGRAFVEANYSRSETSTRMTRKMEELCSPAAHS
ncbi:MAG: glycosyltransferase family 4 protein [Armatimonadota bacterium]|nr:glycosyltransferase family 4 protein [Armatimonadota bacterium]